MVQREGRPVAGAGVSRPDRDEGRAVVVEKCDRCGHPTSSHVAQDGRCPVDGVATTCIEHAYGSPFRLSFQIKVF